MGKSDKSKDVGEQRKYNEGGITGKGFKKGQSGNPSGRPKGAVSIAATLRNVITQDQADAVVANLIALATRFPEQRSFEKTIGEGVVTIYEAYDPIEAKLHQWAVDTILERLDGKVALPLASDGDSPIHFVIDPGKSLGSNAGD